MYYRKESGKAAYAVVPDSFVVSEMVLCHKFGVRLLLCAKGHSVHVPACHDCCAGNSSVPWVRGVIIAMPE